MIHDVMRVVPAAGRLCMIHDVMRVVPAAGRLHGASAITNSMGR